MNGTDVPVFVICRDRLACLVRLVAWLEQAGHHEIVLVDNGSTYAPLVEWLDRSPHRVARPAGDHGHLSPFEAELVPRDRPFVVTDCDVVPDEDCPADAVDHLLDLLLAHDVVKVGLGLRLDDLPAGPARRDVRQMERRFWEVPAGRGVFDAPVDTTFALYRPALPFAVGGLRTTPPYLARHTTWYLDPGDLPPDEAWYLEHLSTPTEWSSRLRQGDGAP